MIKTGWPGITALVGITLAASSALAQNPAEDTRKLVSQWLSVEQQEQRIISSWAREQQQLELRLQLLEEERRQLLKAVNNDSGESDALDETRTKLIAEQQALEIEQGEVERFTREANQLAQAILPGLPPPLAEHWKELMKRAEVEENPSARLQNQLDLFGLLVDFESLVTLTEGLIEIPGGRRVQVQQLYLGASHAWYMSADGQHRGTGSKGPQGWAWQEDERVDVAHLAAAIFQVENKGPSELVQLPLRLHDTSVPQLPEISNAR